MSEQPRITSANTRKHLLAGSMLMALNGMSGGFSLKSRMHSSTYTISNTEKFCTGFKKYMVLDRQRDRQTDIDRQTEQVLHNQIHLDHS